MERSERNARDAVHVIASQERQGDDEKMIARHSVAVVLMLLLLLRFSFFQFAAFFIFSILIVISFHFLVSQMREEHA